MIAQTNSYGLKLSAKRYQVIDVKTEIALFKIIRKGGPNQADAIRRVVDANLKFVIAVAKQHTGLGVPIEDLVNEGAKGMTTAAGKFDSAHGNRFISYAVWWVRQAMLVAIQVQAPNIKTPALCVSAAKLKGAEAKMRSARASEDIDRIQKAILKLEEATEEAAHVQRIRKTENLEGPMDLGLRIQDPTADSGEEVAHWDAARTVNRALGALTPVERAIMRRYFGLDSGGPETLEEVGRRFGLTRERIRQIKAKAILKMRVKLKKEER